MGKLDEMRNKFGINSGTSSGSKSSTGTASSNKYQSLDTHAKQVSIDKNGRLQSMRNYFGISASDDNPVRLNQWQEKQDAYELAIQNLRAQRLKQEEAQKRATFAETETEKTTQPVQTAKSIQTAQSANVENSGGVWERIKNSIFGDPSEVTNTDTDWKKLLSGVWNKGADQYVAGTANTLNNLFGGLAEEIHVLGGETVNSILDVFGAEPIDYGKNFLTRWAESAKSAKEQNLNYYDANSKSTRAAQIIDKFGTSTVAAVPMAVETLLFGLTKGASDLATKTPEALQYVSNLFSSSGLGVYSAEAVEGVKNLLKSPDFWTSYLWVTGDSYDNAKQKGMSDTDAEIYALTNGAINAMIEIGGGDESLGGLQAMKNNLQNDSAILAIGKSMFGEGLEEVEQGIFERGLMSWGGVNTPVASTSMYDDSSIFNPYTAIDEFAGGAIVGAVLGGGQAGIQTGVVNSVNNAKAKKIYSGSVQELVNEGLESAEGTESRRLAEIYNQKLQKTGKLSGSEIRQLVDANEAAIRYEELTAVPEAQEEQQEQEQETVTQEAPTPVQTEPEKSTESTETPTKSTVPTDTTTDKSTTAENAHVEAPETTEIKDVSETIKSKLKDITSLSNDETKILSDDFTLGTPNGNVEYYASGVKEIFNHVKNGLTAEQIKENSAFAKDLTETQFDHAFRMAKSKIEYESGYKRGVTGQTTTGLTTEAGKKAYQEGADFADFKAQDRQNRNDKKKQTGNLKRREGVVSAEGVTLDDLKKRFNDSQRTAYRALSKIAQVTGIDIVLYQSEADENGNITSPEGRFEWKSDKIYIDINSGVLNNSDANDLTKYVMLRTFTHEFTHFGEKWNATDYNTLRILVFQYLENEGQDTDALIKAKQALDSEGKMNYDEASREVVADGLADILPQSKVMERIAREHESLFHHILNSFKQFVARLKQYFAKLPAGPEEMRALKKGGQYCEELVNAWDKMAYGAVENYQMVIGEPASTETTQKEKKPSPQKEKARAEKQKKAEEAKRAADEAKKQSDDFAKKYEEAPADQRKEVVDAINANSNVESVYPTEIHEQDITAPKNKTEVTDNGETEKTDTGRGVLESPSTGEGTSRLLDEVETGDVQRTGTGRGSSKNVEKSGRRSGRDGDQPDAERNGRSRSNGSSESGNLRGSDRVTDDELKLKEITIDLSPKPTEEEVKQHQEEVHEETVQQVEQKSTEKPKGSNYVIGDSLDLPNGSKARYKANVAAIRLVKQLEAENRFATAEEQQILSKYVGWGGLPDVFEEKKANWSKEYKELSEVLTKEEYEAARASTLNAHYTSIPVIKAMYRGLEKLGFKGGRMLEPSSGVGNFVGAMPVSMSGNVRSWTMVELDNITGLIAKYLYPNADVRIEGFEKAIIPNDFMDVAIGNVPFGKFGVTDRAYPANLTNAIHNYFFVKTLDKVRPGGIVMYITTAFTMDSRDNTYRSYIAKKANLLGAIRLPNNAFSGNAGTPVVTDILVLQKKGKSELSNGISFDKTEYTSVKGSYFGSNINEYFVANPEMVLGENVILKNGMYGRDEYSVNPYEDRGSLESQIDKAFENIKGQMTYPERKTPEKVNRDVQRAEKGVKEGSFYKKDGKLYRNEDGIQKEFTGDKATEERVTGMMDIRDAARELLNAQKNGASEKEVKSLRKKLNEKYDAFVKENGFLNSPKNKKAFEADPDRFGLLALEDYDGEKKTAKKADIFRVDTVRPVETISHVDTAKEGLIVSRNTTGGVDLDLIAKLTGNEKTAVERELIDSELVFKDRDGNLIPSEVYLQGNVRAKLRDAQGMVGIDKDYQHNVDSLQRIMPKDVPHEAIYVQLGTPWITDTVYSDFASYMLGRWSGAVSVHRSPETGMFTVELKDKRLKHVFNNTTKWGTPSRSFLNLLEATLNSRSVTVSHKGEDGKSYVDKVATAAANEKVEAITKEFQKWLWEDENRTKDLEYLYNETFNAFVSQKYDGSTLVVNGIRSGYSLRPHQADAVQRIISSGGNVLLAHKVGAGKTLEMSAAAMKLRELGIIQKPVFVVPKSLVAQWGNEFQKFFPMANLLVSGENDFTPANRKTFANRISTGNYDAIIVSYEQFEKLPLSDEYTKQFYQEQIDEVIAAIEEQKASAGKNSMSVKDLEKKKKQLEKKISDLTKKKKDTDSIQFEDLGIDSLFVDEAHNFKNLFYTTSMKNVSGLNNKNGVARSFDLYTKVRYLQQLNGGKGIVFATATPVMNSMSEMYIMQKYLQSDLLKQLGLTTFDAWAKQFGEIVNGLEIKPSGQGYRVKQSFSRFKNVNELQMLFRGFSDVLTKVPGLKIPKMKGGKVHIVESLPGEFQENYMQELSDRADNIKNVSPKEDNMLKITSDGRKISYTQRMIDPSLPYEEDCKIYKCAENVKKEYDASTDVTVLDENEGKTVKLKGTQIIFLDMATPKGKNKTSKAEETDETEDTFDAENAKLYEDLKKRLVKLGIPAKEIAFIHDANTDQKKSKLFADMNNGVIRVLIGSTGKMGVGMNAQKRIVAIHHLDAPWRPGDVEQRNGRAFRQGNLNEEVSDYTYVTKGSFDSRLWDILERKQRFIDQIMNGENIGREAEDTGEVTLSAAEVKAVASGSPLIIEQVQIEDEIKKLENLYAAYRQSLIDARNNLRDAKEKLAYAQLRIAGIEQDLKIRSNDYLDGSFKITINGKTYTDKKLAGEAFMAAALAKANENGYTSVGTFSGFDIQVIKSKEGISGQLYGNQGYQFKTYPDNPTYNITRFKDIIGGLEEMLGKFRESEANLNNEVTAETELMNQPFSKQEELDSKRARYEEIMNILNPKEAQQIDEEEDEDDEGAVEYKRRPTKQNSKEYPTEGVRWAYNTKDFNNSDYAFIWKTVADYSQLGYNGYIMTSTGDRIADKGNKVFILNTDYQNAELKSFYVLNDTDETNMEMAKELIIDAETGGRSTQESIQLIENYYGEGYIVRYDSEVYGYTSERNRGRTGSRSPESTENDRSWGNQLDYHFEDDAEVFLDDIDDGKVQYSRRVTNPETLAFLNKQEEDGDVIKVYKTLQFDELGGLHSPVNGKERVEGQRKLQWTFEFILGSWVESSESMNYYIDPKNGKAYVKLNKGNGKSLDRVAYNPYQHGSNDVLNDQFEEAYNRPNLVTVECIIPKSEMTSGYHAEHAKDPVGKTPWHEGPIASKLKGEDKRMLYLSRWMKPVRIVPEAEVAQMYKNLLSKYDIKVPFNVVTPQLLTELEKIGVPIDYEGSPMYRAQHKNKDVQNAMRLPSLSNTELLQLASAELGEQDLSPEERNALDIFNAKLAEIHMSEMRRKDLGLEYKNETFTKGGSREKSAQLKNKIDIFDNRIKRLHAELLSLENKDILKGVLVKARGVLDEQDKKRTKEAVKEYRERQIENTLTRSYRIKVRDDVDKLRSWLMNPSNKNVVQHIPAELQKSVADFIDMVDFSSKRSLKTDGANPTQADKRYLAAMKRMHDAIKSNMDTQGIYSGYADLPADFLNTFEQLIQGVQAHMEMNSGDYVVNKMTSAELKKLHETLKTLMRYIKTVNSFHNNAMFEHAYEAGEDTIQYTTPFRKSNASGTPYNFMNFQYIRPSYVFERFGKGGVSIEREFREGQATQARLAKQVIEFAQNTFTREEVEDWSKDIKTFTTTDNEEVSLPATHIMSLYCLMKRPQALTHIFGDGIRVANYQDGKKVILDEGHVVTQSDVEAMLDTLTDRQIEVADALQNFMSTTCSDWGNYVSLARFDVQQFTEDHYFPINSDGRYLSATADEMPDNDSLYALLNTSFTKGIKENAKNRLILYNIFDVFANHTASMTQYRSFALPILDALKWFNYKNDTTSVRDKLSLAFGAPVEERAGSGSKGYAETFVLNLLRAYNGTAGQNGSSEAMATDLLHKFNAAQVAFNARVVIQQPMAITRAAMIINPANLMKGVNAAKAHYKQLADEMEAHSGIAAWKALGFYDTNISRGLTTLIKQNADFREKVTDAGMKGAEFADRFTWSAMWYACKISLNRANYDSDEKYMKAVTDLFEEVIYKTQVVDSILTKSEYLREKSFFPRMLGSFMSEPSATISMLGAAYNGYQDSMRRGTPKDEAWKEYGPKIAKTAAVYAVGQILLAAVQSIADAWRDDDDFKTFMEKYLDALKGNIIDELNPASKLPVLSQLYELAKYGLDAFGVFDKLGLDMYGNTMGAAIAAADYFKKVIDVGAALVNGKTGYTPYALIYNIVRAAADITGYPAGTAMREVVDIWNNTVGSFAPSMKLKQYESSSDRNKREGWENYAEPAGVDKDVYNYIMDNYDTDGNGSYKQDEVGAILKEQISDGKLTTAQANAIFKIFWNKENSKTYSEWRAKN